MRKQFFIPRYDTDNNIPTRNEPSEDDDGYNSFSNHPTGTEEKDDYNSFSNHPTGKYEKKWSRSALVKGTDNPGLKNGGRRKMI